MKTGEQFTPIRRQRDYSDEYDLSEDVWKLWREAADFSQCFTGTFSADGNTIGGRWEKSTDSAHWEHDFELTLTKVEANNAAQAHPV
jgi:hypothetical protein